MNRKIEKMSKNKKRPWQSQGRLKTHFKSRPDTEICKHIRKIVFLKGAQGSSGELKGAQGRDSG